MSLQDQYDDAMFDFTQGELDSAIAKFKKILAEDPTHFDAQLSLGMAHYRKAAQTTSDPELEMAKPPPPPPRPAKMPEMPWKKNPAISSKSVEGKKDGNG